MASLKIESLWELISTYNFTNDIPENFHCIICQNVTIKPFIALCECRFCLNCIKEYLKDGKKHCPGGRNDCKEEYLEIDVNVSRDIIAIRNIGRISVKCPNEMCEVRCDLENMNDHLRVCGMSKTKCPYENIGCQLRQISRDNVKTHYDNEWFSHSKLLVEAIDNLRNDVEELKKVVERRDEEINKLTEDSVVKEMMIKEMQNDINVLKERNESKDREIEEMKEEFRMMKETEKKTMMEELENVKRDIVERYVKEDIEDQRKCLNDLRLNQENIEKGIDSVITKVRDARIFDEREFIWRVDNLSKLIKNRESRDLILWRYSLKLFLYLYCEGNYLTFGFRIMNGEFDDLLDWPMKHKITLSLINQGTMKIHKSKEYRCDSFEGDKSVFNKPIKEEEWNNSLTNYVFRLNLMTVRDTANTPGLILNDSLIVSLIIDYNL